MQGKKLRGLTLSCALLAAVASVDITPEARDYIRRMGWDEISISGLYHTCPRGRLLAIVQDGGPAEGRGPHDAVRAGDVTVHVPQDKTFEGDIPRIVSIRMRGESWLGVANEIRE